MGRDPGRMGKWGWKERRLIWRVIRERGGSGHPMAVPGPCSAPVQVLGVPMSSAHSLAAQRQMGIRPATISQRPRPLPLWPARHPKPPFRKGCCMLWTALRSSSSSVADHGPPRNVSRRESERGCCPVVKGRTIAKAPKRLRTNLRYQRENWNGERTLLNPGPTDMPSGQPSGSRGTSTPRFSTFMEGVFLYKEMLSFMVGAVASLSTTFFSHHHPIRVRSGSTLLLSLELYSTVHQTFLMKHLIGR